MRDKIQSIAKIIASVGMAIIVICIIILPLAISIVTFYLGDILLGIISLFLFITMGAILISVLLE